MSTTALSRLYVAGLQGWVLFLSLVAAEPLLRNMIEGGNLDLHNEMMSLKNVKLCVTIKDILKKDFKTALKYNRLPEIFFKE